MGGEQSVISNNMVKEVDNRYNWVQSFVKYNEEIIKYNEEEEDEEKNYCDLRPNMNLIFNEKGNLLILSVCVYLNYLLLNTNKLTPFIVSYDYLLYNLQKLYHNDNSKNNYVNLFNLIKKIGFVSADEIIFEDNKLREDIHELGKNYKYIIYKKVDNDIRLVKRLLNSDKIILIGFPIYTNFETNLNVNHTLNLPKENDSIIGGLSGIICGYIEKKELLIMYIGLSKKLGDRGYIYIPYDYIKKNYSSELWVLELNEDLVLLNLSEKIKKTKMIEEEDNVTLF